MRMLFCNTGWMEWYCGQQSGETIVGGGAWVNNHGHGLEVCNFCDHDGTVYGFVRPPGKTINLERIARKSMGELVDQDTESIYGVLIVWTAPLKGRAPAVVIGWYRNATVYRAYQEFHSAPQVHKINQVDGYRFKARLKDAVLLPVDARTLVIPKHKKGLMGQANIWYADTPESEAVIRNVLKLVEGNSRRSPPREDNTDPEHNSKVEKAAVSQVRKYYSQLSYVVESVESDNVGWDLEARFEDKIRLRIEVKGLSNSEPRVGLTPNEYEKFNEEADGYRLAIVTCAISDSPKLWICRYSAELGKWMINGQDGCEIEIELRTSATVCVSGESCR